MKLLQKDFVPNGPGTITLVAEQSDDLWIAHNLISPGDYVSSDTTRKVQINSGVGKSSTRVKLKLEIKVISSEFDKQGSLLRIRGKITSSTNVSMISGAFHTIEIELCQSFELKKKTWNSSALDVLQQGSGSDQSVEAELVVILMQEGLANLYLIGKGVNTHCAKIEGSSSTLNRKAGSGNTKKGESNKFFGDILDSFTKNVDLSCTSCVVIASPGSIKNQFHSYMISEANRLQLRSIIDNKSRFVLVGANSGNKQSLKEVLDSPTVKNLIKDTKSGEDAQVFKNFMDTLLSNSDRACYGLKSIETALELEAVQTLLIIDDLFRSSNVTTRKKYSNLVDSVKKLGGDVQVFSSANESGEELAKMTGIAAILRFPLPDLDDMEIISMCKTVPNYTPEEHSVFIPAYSKHLSQDISRRCEILNQPMPSIILGSFWNMNIFVTLFGEAQKFH